MWPFILSTYQRFAARRMFSRWSPIYEEEVYENAYSAADKVAEAALPLLAKLEEEPSILDVGIGTGLLAQQMYDAMPCSITGLDFNEDMMAACGGRGITDLLIRCDAGKDFWPLENQAFDCVVSAGLMEYLTPDMLQHFLFQAKRVVKQDGFVTFTYVPKDKGEKSLNLWRGHSGTYLVCHYDPPEIEQYLKDSGFKIEQHTQPFKGCVFGDGSSYDYRLITARS